MRVRASADSVKLGNPQSVYFAIVRLIRCSLIGQYVQGGDAVEDGQKKVDHFCGVKPNCGLDCTGRSPRGTGLTACPMGARNLLVPSSRMRASAGKSHVDIERRRKLRCLRHSVGGAAPP